MMLKKYLLAFLLLLLVINNNLQAGLPSAEKLQALKKRVDQELSKYFRIKNELGLCLAVNATLVRQAGAKVKAVSCTLEANQKWSLVGAQLHLAGGMCLQPQGDPAQVGNELEIANCSGLAKQNWGYEKMQMITSAGTCVELTGGGAKIAKCDASKAQQMWKPN